MKPLREILPAGAGRSDEPPFVREDSESTQQSTSSSTRKRPQTRIACTPCRRRKSKCDGRRPVCTACATSGLQECEYDGDPDLTRTAALRKKNDELQRRNELFEELFEVLSRRTDDDSIEILRRMRHTNLKTELEELVRFIKDGDLLVQLSTTGGAKLADGEDPPPTSTEVLLVSDEVTSLLASLNTLVTKLGPSARVGFVEAFKARMDEMADSEMVDAAEAAKQRLSIPSLTIPGTEMSAFRSDEPQ